MSERAAREERKAETLSKSRVDENVEILRGLSGITEIFSTPGGDLYATIEGQGRRRTIPLESSEFRSWLVAEFYAAQGRAPSGEAAVRARALFETQARFGSAQHEVFVRFGQDESGDLWLDLGDPTGRAVRIDPEGWQVTDQSGVRFRRPDGLLPLPEPVSGGHIVSDA